MEACDLRPLNGRVWSNPQQVPRFLFKKAWQHMKYRHGLGSWRAWYGVLPPGNKTSCLSALTIQTNCSL